MTPALTKEFLFPGNCEAFLSGHHIHSFSPPLPSHFEGPAFCEREIWQFLHPFSACFLSFDSDFAHRGSGSPIVPDGEHEPIFDDLFYAFASRLQASLFQSTFPCGKSVGQKVLVTIKQGLFELNSQLLGANRLRPPSGEDVRDKFCSTVKILKSQIKGRSYLENGHR